MNGTSTERIRETLKELQAKLLDITGNNKLVNFKHTKGRSLRFVEGILEQVYERLVQENKSIRIEALPEPTAADYVTINDISKRPDEAAWAASQDISHSFDLEITGVRDYPYKTRTLLYEKNLLARCRNLEREARLAIQETGSNMLFLILGFLEFPDRPGGQRKYQAPLISIPVTLNKKKVHNRQHFEMEYTGEDIADNLSLINKLDNDFGITLPAFDEDSINIPDYLGGVSDIIENQRGFILKPWMTLGLMSFSNMMLFRDLDPERWQKSGNNTLIEHPLMGKLFGMHDEQQRDTSLYGHHSEDVENEIGDRIPLVFDADSSQHEAIMDVIHNERDIVIEGPPGTGKSQTISNLIAACLQRGKKVLFIAEKMAALEVVRNRLAKAQLDVFTLELHSNKTNRKVVLDDIKRRMDLEWEQVKNSAEAEFRTINRKSLRNYSNILNTKVYNSLGLNIYQLIWRRERQRHMIKHVIPILDMLRIDGADKISKYELYERKQKLSEFSKWLKEIKSYGGNNPSHGFQIRELLPDQIPEIQALFERISKKASLQINLIHALNNAMGQPLNGFERAYWINQEQLLKNYIKTLPEDVPYDILPRFIDQDYLSREAEKKVGELEDYLKAIKELSERIYPVIHDSAPPLDEDALEMLKSLRSTIYTSALQTCTVHDISLLIPKLHVPAVQLEQNLTGLSEELYKLDIDPPGHIDDLMNLEEVCELFSNIDADIFLYTGQWLSTPEVKASIEQLASLQRELRQKWQQLEELFYTDIMPEKGNVRQALLKLREGDRWYRILQKDWREAINLHKKLCRRKDKYTAAERLEGLTLLFQTMEDSESFKEHSLWKTISVYQQKDFLDFDMQPFVDLARWHDTYIRVQRTLQNKIISEAALSPDVIYNYQQIFERIKRNIEGANNSIQSIKKVYAEEGLTPSHSDPNRLKQAIISLCEAMEGAREWVSAQLKPASTIDDAITGVKLCIVREEKKNKLNRDTRFQELLCDHFRGKETSIEKIKQLITIITQISQANLDRSIKKMLLTENLLHNAHTLAERLGAAIEEGESLFNDIWALEDYGSISIEEFAGCNVEDDAVAFLKGLRHRCDLLLENLSILELNSMYNDSRARAIKLQLGQIVDLLEQDKISENETEPVLDYMVCNSILNKLHSEYEDFRELLKHDYSHVKKEFAKYDKLIINNGYKKVIQDTVRNTYPPTGVNGTRVSEKTEMFLLNYLMPQSRPRVTLRKLFSRAAKAIQEYKPCFMMGPQAVAQYLQPNSIEFDIVIMDEASQLKPEQAIGSIVRGKQLVVVGDSKQLPPTSFFQKFIDNNDSQDDGTISDLESILDICSAQLRNIKSLKWHYRSQHHSLIAFSNDQFYDNKLMVFPSPYHQGGQLGVKAIYLQDAYYENQENLKEAERVTDIVLEHIMKRSKDSIGVVTLNSKQRDLIYILLDEKIRGIETGEAFMKQWEEAGEPLFIKNLETVQGDERDCIIISTTFGKAQRTKRVNQNFGPISREGGWRRLNVLFTRAKKSITLVTSLQPDDIVERPDMPKGTRALRDYLSYIRSGELPVTSVVNPNAEPDSDFEVAVIEMLQSKGYEVVPQLGVAGYRIDIAVKHPEKEGSYLAAIECDGASYHSAKSVRDRDRIRQEILESLGWKNKFWRIWSTDWYSNSKAEFKKLTSFLEAIKLNTSSVQHGSSWIIEGEQTEEPDSREELREEIPDIDPTLRVEIGDTVVYRELQGTKKERKITISHNQRSGKSELYHQKPLALALLNAEANQEVIMELNEGRKKKYRILKIYKNGTSE